MRSRSKILAFVLAVLMVAGLVPFSIFAVDGDTGSTTQTREEYVTASGGTMLFGTSFDDSSKISGDRVSSSTAGSGSITRTNASGGDTKVWVDTASGALRLQSGEQPQDFWPLISVKAAAGDNVIFEFSFSVNKQIPGEDNIMYSTHDFGDQKIRPSILKYRPLGTGADGKGKVGLIIGASKDVSYEFSLGDTVNLAVVIEPTTKRVHLYVDGKYIDTGVLHQQNYNKIPDSQNGGYPSFNNVRFFQISNDKNQDIAVYDLYVYSNVELPYKTTKAAEDAFGYFISTNDAKILSHYDFEDIDYRNIGTLADGVYTFTDNTTNGDGSQYNYASIDGGNRLMLQPKYGPAQVMKDDSSLNWFLRLNCASPTQKDSYFNTYQTMGTNGTQKHVKDEVIVIHRSYRVSPSYDGNTVNLMSFRNRDVAGSGKHVDVGVLNMNQNGAIVCGGEVIGKMKSGEFTDVDVILDVKNNKYSVAIDGVIVSRDNVLLSQSANDAFKTKDANWTTGDYVPNEIRCSLNNDSYAYGYIDFDNLYVYCGAKLSDTNFCGVNNNNNVKKNTWEQTDEGYWRYYGADGLAVIGTQEINGKTYYFDGSGYFSTIERDWLFSFDEKTDNGAISFSDKLSASSDVTSSSWNWKYSALWTNWYYEGTPGTDQNIYTLNKMNANGIYFRATSSAVNPEFVRTLTEAEANAIPTAQGTEVFDFRGYQGIELQWYTDKSVDAQLKMILRTPFTGYSKYNNPVVMQEGITETGWNRTVLDITLDSNLRIGGSDPLDMANRGLNFFKEFSFELDWDQPNDENYCDNVKLYIGGINLVKYSPVKSDVSPDELGQVREENGKIYVYADTSHYFTSTWKKESDVLTKTEVEVHDIDFNMSYPAIGWTDVGGDRYYCNPDGTAVTGVNTIAGKTYHFDDKGKLIGNADGIYTINGKNYYYSNGVCKFGEFTAMHNGAEIKINTKGDGEIISMKGAVPGYLPAGYKKPDYSKLDSGNVLVKADFNDYPTTNPESGHNQDNVPYIGASFIAEIQKDFKNKGSSGSLGAVIRRTRFYYVEENPGDVALKMYNENVYRDSYMDANFNLTPDVVFEASFKLGDDWNTGMGLIQVQDRGADGKKNQAAGTLALNSQGYVTIGNVILCRLSTEAYTRISVVHDDDLGENGSLIIYINGVKVYTYAITNSSFDKPNKIRVAQYYSGDDHGTIYVDDVIAYTGTTPVEVVNVEKLKDGLVTENGFTRYYENGVIKTGVVNIADEEDPKIERYFDPDNGIAFTGTGFIDGAYYVDGIKAYYSGPEEIDGNRYLFGEDNKIITNHSCALDPNDGNKAYSVDENGIIIAEFYKGEIVNFDGEDLGNAEYDNGTINAGDFVYDEELGTTVLEKSFIGETNLLNFVESADLTQYDYLNIRLYVSDYFADNDAFFRIFFGRDMVFYLIEGYDPATNTYSSISTVASADVKEAMLSNTGKSTGDYRPIYKSKTEDLYYARSWDYKGMADTDPTYNISSYGKGWVTVSVDLSKYDQNFLKKINKVRLISSGWTLLYIHNETKLPAGLNVGVDETETFKIAGVSLVKYTETEETLNGWSDGRYYINGEMQFGWLDYEGVQYYLDTVTGLKFTGVQYVPSLRTRVAGAYYDFGTVGVCQGLANGKCEITVTVLNKDTGRYEDVTGYRILSDGAIADEEIVQLDGKTYYVDPVSKLVLTNTIVRADVDGDGDEEVLYLGDDGAVGQVFGQWVEADGKKYYCDESGNFTSGYAMIDGEYYYFDPSDGNAMVSNKWVTVYDTEMYFGADGKAATGVVTVTGMGAVDDLMYFIDGVPSATEYIMDGFVYKFDASGKCTEKTAITEGNNIILIWVIKDGVKTPFYFDVKDGEKFEKTFETFSCYTFIVTDVDGKEIALTENTLSLVNVTESATYTVRYRAVEHVYDEGTVIYQPTCGEPGLIRYVCTLCGAAYSEYIPATGEHEFGEWEVVLAPTCTYVGIERRVCSCGITELRDVEIDPDNHVYDKDNWTVIRPATCAEEGVSYGYCQHCGTLGYAAIPMTEHVFGEWTVELASTCKVAGREYRECVGCGLREYRDAAIDPNAHDETRLVLFQTIKEPTCVAEGIGTYRCLDCGGFVYNRAIAVDPEAHNWDEGVIEDPDKNCGYDVEKIYTCQNEGCGHTKTETIPAGTLGTHSVDLDNLQYVTNAMDPLYGYHYNVCTKCGKAFNVEAHTMGIYTQIDGVTHTVACECGFSHTEDCEYVLMTDGDNHWYECACGATKDVEAHSFVAKFDENGHWEECEVCAYKRNEAAHNIITYEKVDATCYAPGHEEYKKCDCGYYEVEEVIIPQTSHKISGEYSADETGHWYACENPGCDFKYQIQDHTYIDMEEREATCTTDGWNAHKVCAVCGYSPDIVLVPAYGHDVAGQTMYFDDENHWQICKRCNEMVVTAHSYPTDTSLYEDYDDEEGTAYVKCEHCDYKKFLTGLETWWSKLGLEREGDTPEEYKYTYKVNGEIVKDTLVNFADGTYRYFDDNGYLVRDTFNDDNTFDKIVSFVDGIDGERGAIKEAVLDTAEGIFSVKDAALQKGWVTLANNKSYFFYDPATNAYDDKKEGVLVTADNPDADDLTIKAWDRLGKKVVICNVEADGAHLIGVVKNGDGTSSLYLDGTIGKHMNGIIEDTGYTNKKYYAIDGILMKGNLLIGDVYYVFDDDYVLNRMCRNEIITFNGETVYVNNDGKKAMSEWVTIAEERYYIDAENKPATGYFYVIDSVYYDFDEEGKYIGKSNGWLPNGDDASVSYVVDGNKQVNTFCTIEEKEYFFDSNGVKISNKAAVYIGSSVYSFDADGIATKIEDSTEGIWVEFLTGGKGYFKNGLLRDELLTIMEEEVEVYYYFDDHGVMVTDKKVKIDGVTYIFDLDGRGKKVTNEL